MTEAAWGNLAPRAAWRRDSVSVAGGRLAYWRTGGGGPTVVLSHGFTDNGLCWARLALELDADFDLILIDARGHGESARIDPATDFDPADDLLAVCQALALDRPMAIGHSLGARATLDLAGRRPDLYAGIVLEDPPLGPPLDRAAYTTRRARIAADIMALQQQSDAEIRRRGEAATPDWPADEFVAWTASKREVDPYALPFVEQPWQAALATVTAPTLLLHGEAGRGSMVPEEAVAEARRRHAGLTAIRIPGAGHNLRRENYAAYVTAIRPFIGGLAPSTQNWPDVTVRPE